MALRVSVVEIITPEKGDIGKATWKLLLVEDTRTVSTVWSRMIDCGVKCGYSKKEHKREQILCVYNQ